MKKALSLVLAMLMVLSTMSCLTVTSLGADDVLAQVEDNNTSETAKEILVSEKYNGRLTSSEDEEWYKFTNDKDYFTLNLSDCEETDNFDGWWTITIYDSELNEVKKFEDIVNYTSLKITLTGTFYVRITAFSDALNWIGVVNREYSITVNTMADPYLEKEYNNDYANANPINPGETYYGLLDNSADADWFKFTNDKDYFTLNLSDCGEADNFDGWWTITIYDSELNEVKKFEDIVNYTSLKITLTGTFYVRITAFSDALNWIGVVNREYSITVNTMADPYLEKEYNNDYANANPINPGETYYGLLDNSADADWFKFTNDKDYFTLNLSDCGEADNFDGWWTITIYDSELNEVKTYSNAANLRSTRFALNGTFYVKITAFSNFLNWVGVVNRGYSLKAETFEGGSWEKEYNNEQKTANEIKQGQTYKGSLSFDGYDVDCYKFTSTSNAFRIKFSLNAEEMNPDRIYDGWRVVIYSADDTNVVLCDNVVNTMSGLESTVLPYGKGNKYIVKISAVNANNAPLDETYSFSIVDATGGKTWELENNKSSLTNAMKVNIGDKIYGNFYSGSDMDYFKVTIPASGKISIKFNRTLSDKTGSGWRIVLQDAAGSEVESVDLGNSLNAKYTSKTLTKAGIYFVRLECVDSYVAPVSYITYNLTFNYTMTAPKLSSVANTTSGVELKWSKVSGCQGYYVYRQEDKTWKKIATVKGYSKDTYTDKTAKNGKAYAYKVKAYDGKIQSADSATKKIIFISAPKLSSVANTTSGVELKWTKVSGCQGYYVYRQEGKTWKKIAIVKGYSKVTYTDKTAKNGKAYTYKVKAYDGKNQSADSATKKITFISAPKAKSIATTKAGITFIWNKVTGATGYEVYRATGNGSYKKIVTVKKGSVVKFIDKSAKKGQTYKYKVRAYKGSAKSAFSSVKTIKDKY